MDRYITITSQDQNPSDFISHFGENLYLEGDYEIALKTIYHAPAFNITETENIFEIYDKKTELRYGLKVPPGFYENETDVLSTIYQVLQELFEDPRFKNVDEDGDPLSEERPEPVFKKQEEKFVLGFQKPLATRFTFIAGPSSPLTRYLGYIFPTDVQLVSLTINGNTYLNTITPGFVYCSCVENSIVDMQQSRLLAMVPFESNSNYNYISIENPPYVPLASNSLRDVSFTICDREGKLLRLESKNEGVPPIPTMLVLHLRKRV